LVESQVRAEGLEDNSLRLECVNLTIRSGQAGQFFCMCAYVCACLDYQGSRRAIGPSFLLRDRKFAVLLQRSTNIDIVFIVSIGPDRHIRSSLNPPASSSITDFFLSFMNALHVICNRCV
jgi:hypothetical protein